MASFEAWGIKAAVERFVGMFAFGVWDRQERTLFLCRDRVGEKPLYYGWSAGVFLFGSELKALKAYSAFSADINRDALTLYLRHNYVPAPHSIYKGIYKLPPATIATLKWPAISSKSDPLIEPYWSMKEVVISALENPIPPDDNAAINQLDSLLRDAIAGQMVADVPLGAFLSGGVDSSTIVALMQSQSSRPVKTFTIGFYEGGYNEAEYAKNVARHLGTEHTELYVTEKEARGVIPSMPYYYDEPFSDSSQIPTHLVSRLARNHVAVSLSGDAGDELFGGYNRYMFAGRLWDVLRRFSLRSRKSMSSLILSIPIFILDHLVNTMSLFLPRSLSFSQAGDKIHKLAGLFALSKEEHLYQCLVSHWNEPSAVVIGGKEPSTVLMDSRSSEIVGEFTQRMMFLDTLTYLPDDILVKVDRAAMSVSLESRVPFLDHRLIEWAWRVPMNMKIRNGDGKWLLRQVLYRYVPRQLIERPKQGFGVPISSWLRGPLHDWAEDMLDENRLRREGYFDPRPIREKWQEHLTGRRNWQYHLWDILMFQAWLSQAKLSK